MTLGRRLKYVFGIVVFWSVLTTIYGKMNPVLSPQCKQFIATLPPGADQGSLSPSQNAQLVACSSHTMKGTVAGSVSLVLCIASLLYVFFSRKFKK